MLFLKILFSYLSNCIQHFVAVLPLYAPSVPKGTITASLYFTLMMRTITCYFLHVGVSDLHDVFDHRLVGADLGALQPADVLTDPGD